MTLLAFAPVAYILVSEGKPIFAALCWLGIQTVEPWPDQDFHLPGLTHRGISHSLLAILVVGGVLGTVGWFLGGNLFDLLLAALLAGGDLFGWVLGLLPDASADMIDLLLPNVSLEAAVDRAHRIAGESVNQWTFAVYGLFVGSYGIFSHLLGDVITMSGIKPFLPLSRWRLALSSLRADSPTANSSLFFIGILAVAVVLAMTVPAALGLAVPADLSPIGLASAQDASPSAHNGSVTINETATNRSRIVLEGVTLPQNGYIVARTGNLSANQSATEVVGHTQYVQNGSFHGVVLELNESVEKGATVVVTLHNDTNGKRTWDGTRTDGPYRSANGTPIHDSVRLGANTTASTQSGASVVFRNQTTNGSVVTIERVTLPDNGFVAIHTSEYLAGPAPAEYSIVAVSDHLSAGTHRNVTIDISHAPPRNPPGLNRSRLNSSQTLSAVVYRDADDDHQFDFVRTYGDNDSAVRENSSIVADSARVRVPEPEPTTASVVFRNQTLRNDTLTVAQVRLPRGGFVVAHNASYQRTGDAVTSVIGSSRYLSPGNYTNVTIPVSSDALDETQVVTVRPSLDTNDNQRYDFVQTGGFRDVAYEDRTGNQSRVITDSALVRVPGSGQQVTDSRTRTQTATANAPATTKTPSAPTSRADRGEGGLFGLGVIPTIVGILVVLVVLPSVIRKFF